MTLEAWKHNSWLREYSTSREEVGNILNLIDRDLLDATRDEISAVYLPYNLPNTGFFI